MQSQVVLAEGVLNIFPSWQVHIPRLIRTRIQRRVAAVPVQPAAINREQEWVQEAGVYI